MEKQIKKLPHPKHFVNRLLINFLVGMLLLAFSLILGVLGYHRFFHLGWIDSLYNASLILTGMGPVAPAPGAGAKIFGSIYSIYSGVAFLSSVAIIFGPVVHRFLHRFHLDIGE
jgi:hypothetical protein